MKIKFWENILEYNIKGDSIFFWSSGIDENKDATILFNNFLLDTSKDHEVFFHAYRLPDVCDIIDINAIISKAEILLDPFNTFFHLKEARVKSNSFDNACQAKIYYFDKRVNWNDFLVTSSRIKSSELIKAGLLSAQFSSLDQSADFWFECSRKYESKVLQLIEEMSGLGWVIKKSNNLVVPHAK